MFKSFDCASVFEILFEAVSFPRLARSKIGVSELESRLRLSPFTSVAPMLAAGVIIAAVVSLVLPSLSSYIFGSSVSSFSNSSSKFFAAVAVVTGVS